jgi:hypothetical protein
MKEKILLTRDEYKRIRSRFLRCDISVRWMDAEFIGLVVADYVEVSEDAYVRIKRSIDDVSKDKQSILNDTVDEIFGNRGYLKYDVGDYLYCKNDFYTEGVEEEGGEPIYRSGQIYRCEYPNCITDENDDDLHGMSFLGLGHYFDVVDESDVEKLTWEMGVPYVVDHGNHWVLAWSTSDYRKFVIESKKQSTEDIFYGKGDDYIRLDLPSGEIQDLARKTY